MPQPPPQVLTPVAFDDLDFGASQQYQHGAYYKGQPFTGMIQELDNGILYEWNYKDGQAHGHWYEHHQESGQQLLDEQYHHGQYHGTCQTWNEAGQLTRYSEYEQGTVKLLKRWNEAGVLVKLINPTDNIDEEYYDDGTLYYRVVPTPMSNGDKHIQYFLGNESNWLATDLGFNQEANQWLYEFNDSWLMANLKQLTAVFHQRIINGYIRALIKRDRQSAFQLLVHLANHSEDWFRSEAAYFFGELGDKAAIPHLRQLRSDKVKPSVTHRWGYSHSTNIHTIGERAHHSIKKLQQRP